MLASLHGYQKVPQLSFFYMSHHLKSKLSSTYYHYVQLPVLFGFGYPNVMVDQLVPLVTLPHVLRGLVHLVHTATNGQRAARRLFHSPSGAEDDGGHVEGVHAITSRHHQCFFHLEG